MCVFVIFTFCFYEIPKCNQNGIFVKNKRSTFQKGIWIDIRLEFKQQS